jgi:hypothetical protein
MDKNLTAKKFDDDLGKLVTGAVNARVHPSLVIGILHQAILEVDRYVQQQHAISRNIHQNLANTGALTIVEPTNGKINGILQENKPPAVKIAPESDGTIVRGE